MDYLEIVFNYILNLTLQPNLNPLTVTESTPGERKGSLSALPCKSKRAGPYFERFQRGIFLGEIGGGKG